MCPETYSGGSGYQCHPLIIKIEHDYGREFQCIEYDVIHSLDGPRVTSYSGENASFVSREEKITGYWMTTTYLFGISIPKRVGCEYQYGAKITFLIYPPRRGFHCDDTSKHKPPFYHYDSSNPSCQLKIQVKRGNHSNSDQIRFEETNNGDTENHLNFPSEQIFRLIVNVSSDGIDIETERVN